MSIDDFIATVAPKLRGNVRKTYTKMRGSELKLTGYKEVKGEPIDDNKVYRIPVPLVERVDHKHKLRLAWLRGGVLAVRNYLAKYLKPDVLEKVITALDPQKKGLTLKQQKEEEKRKARMEKGIDRSERRAARKWANQTLRGVLDEIKKEGDGTEGEGPEVQRGEAEV